MNMVIMICLSVLRRGMRVTSARLQDAQKSVVDMQPAEDVEEEQDA